MWGEAGLRGRGRRASLRLPRDLQPVLPASRPGLRRVHPDHESAAACMMAEGINLSQLMARLLDQCCRPPSSKAGGTNSKNKSIYLFSSGNFEP